jgi:subtilase family serine protease
MKLALVLAVIASSVGYSAAFAANHIPQLVNAMSDAGKLQEATLLPVMFALKLNNEDELNARIAEIYRFGSSTYHQFLSSDEFKSKYAPTEAQIERERAFLESSGISVASISENQMFIRAFASVATLNQVFKTELHNFSHPNGKTYFAPAQDVQIPEDSRITSIIGLNVQKIQLLQNQKDRLQAVALLRPT